MQQALGMDFAQTVEQAREYVADEGFADGALVLADVLLQGAAAFVLHDHVHRVVGAEEVEHAHDVGMVQVGQGAAFLEKALHAMAKGRQVFLGDGRGDLPGAAQCQRIGQVFLDRHRLVVLVVGQIDDREAAERKLPRDAVAVELEAGGQGLVGLLGGHGWYTGRHCSVGA